MTLEQLKLNILADLKEELLHFDIIIRDKDIHSTTNGNSWVIWVERDGVSTKSLSFLVDLGDLEEGVSYGMAVQYRMRRWVQILKKDGAKNPEPASFRPKGVCTILLAEDDEDDCFMIDKALKTNQVTNPLVTVPDGEQLLDYLYRRGKFSDPKLAPWPCFILLDLNMPRMDGRTALKVLKKDENLRKIPVVVLTTSQSEEDIANIYESGASSYITKPSNSEGFTKIIQNLKNYWLNYVELPVG